MQKIALIFKVAIFLAGMGSAESFDPVKVVKSVGNYKMGWGPYENQLFWDYRIEEKLKFRVVAALVPHVDEMLDIARDCGANVIHIDEEVTFFCEMKDVDENLGIVAR